jgi:hypothetical protein
MMESEWLACDDPQPMLEFVRGKVSDRKLRLFACACCRAVWDKLTDSRSRQAVELAERYANGLATEEELRSARLQATAAWKPLNDHDLSTIAMQAEECCDLSAADAAAFAVGREPFPGPAAQAALLRDLVGNPFRPVALDRRYVTPAVVALARAAYEERAFDRLPILADALEEAGVTDAQLLGHLRGPGPHALGCWALDAILGKE